MRPTLSSKKETRTFTHLQPCPSIKHQCLLQHHSRWFFSILWLSSSIRSRTPSKLVTTCISEVMQGQLIGPCLHLKKPPRYIVVAHLTYAIRSIPYTYRFESSNRRCNPQHLCSFTPLPPLIGLRQASCTRVTRKRSYIVIPMLTPRRTGLQAVGTIVVSYRVQ